MNERSFFLNDRLSDKQIEKFKLFEDEELIFACREHWLPLVMRLIREVVIGIVLALFSSIAFYYLLQNISLTVGVFIFILLLGSIAIVRRLIHWSFHLYIATNKQIIELHYSPLISQAINSVLLDQIRCTEIDVNMFGILPELIGIGDVEITFDRPTHKEMFVIKSIRSPHTIANLLSAQIHQSSPSIKSSGVKQPIWIRELKKNRYRFLGEKNYGLVTS